DVMVGDRDEFAPRGDVETLLKALPSGRLEVVPECDHFFMTACPDVGRIARSFLVRGESL
ncbi:MAG: alpha/beta hydrolase, partial [Myxococcota bacterium]